MDEVANRLLIVPITWREGNDFVVKTHRHHGTVAGCKFAIGLYDDETLRGVALCGRPVARMLDDGLTLEVNRVATDGVKNGCSMLYGACRRIAREMGYCKIITYTLASEPGTSLKASGWKFCGPAGGGSWSVPSRPRKDKHPVEPKSKWESDI